MSQAYGANGSLPALPGPSSLYPGMPSLPDIPADDFAWDQSHVGSYDPATASTFASLINNTGTAASSADIADEQAAAAAAEGLAATDVLGGIMEQKKWGPQGGAPLFNTPNCE